jgi:hypothetical protein
VPTAITIAPTVLAAQLRLRTIASWPTPGSSPWATAAEISVLHNPGAEIPTVIVQDPPPCVPVAGPLLPDSDSQETMQEDGRSSNVSDGSVETLWVTQYTSGVDTHPHRLDFALGEATPVCGVIYTPRQDSSNGRIEAYELYTCLVDCGPTGSGWTLRSAGAFANSAAPSEIAISPSVLASSLRLRTLASWPIPGLSPWATVAEFTIYRDHIHDDSAPEPGAASPSAGSPTLHGLEERLPR